MTTTILQGVVGSQAQGFAGPDSDTDRGRIVLTPVLDLLWDGDTKTVQHHDPDVWEMELRTFIRLAMKSNPTVLELLFLPTHEVVHPAGALLLNIRESFLYTEGIYNACKGSARVQFESKHDPKHRRHALRHLLQGIQAMRTGTIIVNPIGWHAAITEAVVDEEKYKEFYNVLNLQIDSTKAISVLPSKPNQFVIRDTFNTIRDRWGA